MSRRTPIVLVVTFLALPMACGTEPSPVVTGCSTASHRGKTWTLSGCSLGPSSFRTEITGSAGSACFQATCSRGCLATVIACD